ncbi:Putative PA domain, peptidase M28, PA domain superfamily [Colletotrichum destructivum]|uniref:Peptide hydrolase n=1 Tax=Colletotrichum destructivum TaxID=34406 RepID=A0AAX4IYJ1_9PEZI|nr:Putative PA domain, peptidase M28, PA domain superfamily [Colletotrichum destructivum]
MKTTYLSAAAAALALASTTLATDLLTADKIEADIKTVELERILWNLNKIGRDNGGTRAFGTPGYKASVDFVLERAQTRFAKQMNTWLQPFNHTFEQTNAISVTGPDGVDVIVLSAEYNTATPLPGGITAPLVDTPVDDENGSGCLPEAFEGIDATGKLALVKRGVCAISDKIKNAKAAGALGVILYNQVPGNEIIKPTLGAENIGLLVPLGIITLETGEAWSAALAAGDEVTVTLIVDSIFEERETWNVISETKEGDPDKVIMLGAHLDSVLEGPGINDDGSGTAALLQLMGSVKKYSGFPHKIRFAWWAAEEAGLVGSYYYTENLSSEEADKIKYYFNYDMIASPNPIYELASYNNSGIGPKLLADYLEANGKVVSDAEFDGRSDYAGFVELGIPTASIFTGEGENDPCYHLACDDIDNINWEALTLNTKAAGRALATLANSLEGVPPRADTTPALRGRAGVLQQFRRWKKLAEHSRHGKTCSHNDVNKIY